MYSLSIHIHSKGVCVAPCVWVCECVRVSGLTTPPRPGDVDRFGGEAPLMICTHVRCIVRYLSFRVRHRFITRTRMCVYGSRNPSAERRRVLGSFLFIIIWIIFLGGLYHNSPSFSLYFCTYVFMYVCVCTYNIFIYIYFFFAPRPENNKIIYAEPTVKPTLSRARDKRR